MSIPVDLADLARTLGDFGTGYLLSTAGVQVKAVTVEPLAVDDGLLVRGPGGGTLRNVAANPAVTLLLPPLEVRGYTLLVDAHAALAPDGAEDLLLAPDHAVLHRPADHAGLGDPADHAERTRADSRAESHATGGTSACGHDCHPVTR